MRKSLGETKKKVAEGKSLKLVSVFGCKNVIPALRKRFFIRQLPFSSPYNICGTPFLGTFVTLCAIGHHVGHNGIAESALVLVHQYGLAAVMREVVLQVATEV